MQTMPAKANLVTLSPHDRQRATLTETVGYANGDLPSILTHINGHIFELFPGQSIPTGGGDVLYENPYERTGTVELFYNAPPQPMADSRVQEGSRQRGFVTYKTGSDLNAVVETAGFMGVAIVLDKGRSRLSLNGSVPFNTHVLSGLSFDDLDNLPVDAFATGEEVLKHSTSVPFPRAIIKTGSFAWGGVKGWIEGQGFVWESLHLYDSEGDLTIDTEGPTLVLLNMKLLEGETPPNFDIVLEDFGVREGSERV